MSAAAGAFAQGFASTFMPIFMSQMQRRWELQDRAADRALQMDMLVKQNAHLLEREERARFHEITMLLVQAGDVEGAAAMLGGMDLPESAMAGVRRAVQGIADAKALERAGALHENVVGEVTRITEEVMPYIREDPRFFITGAQIPGDDPVTVPNIIGLINPMTGEPITAETGGFETYDQMMSSAKNVYTPDFWARIAPQLPDETKEAAYRMWIIDNPPPEGAPPEIGLPVAEAEAAGIKGEGGKGLVGRIVDAFARDWEYWMGGGPGARALWGERPDYGPGPDTNIAGVDVPEPADNIGGDTLARRLAPRGMPEPAEPEPPGGLAGLFGEGFGQTAYPGGFFKRAEPEPPTSIIGPQPQVTPPEPADNIGVGTPDLGPRAPTPPALHERPGTTTPFPPAAAPAAPPPAPQARGRGAGLPPGAPPLATRHEYSQPTAPAAPGEMPVSTPGLPAPPPQASPPGTGDPIDDLLAEASRRVGQPGPAPAAPQMLATPPTPPPLPAVPGQSLAGGGAPPRASDRPFAEQPPDLSTAAEQPRPTPQGLQDLLPEPAAGLDNILFPAGPQAQQPMGPMNEPAAPTPQPAQAEAAPTEAAARAGTSAGTTLAVGFPEEVLNILGIIEGTGNLDYQDGNNRATAYGIAKDMHVDPATGQLFTWTSDNPPDEADAARVALSLLEPGSTFDDAVVEAFGPDLPARERTALVIAAYRWGGRGFLGKIAEMPEFVAAVRARDPDGVARGFNALSGDRRGKVETAIFFNGLPPAGEDVIQWSEDADDLIRGAK